VRVREAQAKSLLQGIARSPHQKVKVAVTDIDGILRGKYLHKEKFLAAAESGFGFCNVVFGWDSGDVCYENSAYTGWHTGYPDAKVRIDPATHRTVPWDGDVPFFLGEFVDEQDRPLAVCPRQLLKGVLDRARRAGYSAKCGLEFEWFNFKETPQSLAAKGYLDPTPLTPGMFGYSILRSSLNQPYFTDLMDKLRAFGVPLEGLHTETGPGVFEAAIAYSDALEAADRAVLFKTSVKEIAYRHGIVASFMAKWNATLPGSGGHLHLSLWDAAGAKNVFHDTKDPAKMSPTYKSFLAGQLRCLPEILPFFAPTVNSYKRLVDGYWSPTRSTWGVDNRTTAFRVIPGGSKSTRVEVRIGGADLNPYLAVAAAVASGLYGVEKGLELTDAPIVGSAYKESSIPRLPRTLAEATDRLAASSLARELFGEAFVDHYVRTRRWEWSQFADAVTSWEMKRYFEIV
jgi:glutamine synthetase